MASETVVSLFRERVAELHGRPALRDKRQGWWRTTTWTQWSRHCHQLAAALCARGLAPGDRVAIAASTSLPWVVADLAVLLAGGITVPLYPSLSREQAERLITDCGARFVFVDSPAQAAPMFGRLGKLTVVSFDTAPQGKCDTVSSSQLEAEGRALLRDEGRARALRQRGDQLCGDDVASVVYSSGTTGHARGVVLTHRNLVFEVGSINQALELSPSDEQLLFLPLAHIFGRMLVLVQIGTGMVTAFAESPFKALDNMREINPTLFASVPRLFEKIYAVAQHDTRHHGPLRQRLTRWAFQVGEAMTRAKVAGRHIPRVETLQHRYADKLVLSQIRKSFGSRLRFAVSGGAPLSEPLARWFYAAGVLILEVYGLTECTGGATLNRLHRFAFGSVGEPLPAVEVRIAEDGEIFIRGGNVMRGYWNQPEATARAIDAAGWLHTGDIGELRPRPSGGDARLLYITGRKKDLIVTDSGHNIAPRKVELLLESSPWINRALVFGDQRPYPVALLTLDTEALRRWATDRGVELPEAAKLADCPDVRGLIDTEIELANQQLDHYERIQRFAVLDDEWSVEGGELTDTMKVKRAVVVERHRELIESLYGASQANSETDLPT